MSSYRTQVDERPDVTALTREERDLVRLVARGLTDKELTDVLKTTPEAVAADIRRLCAFAKVENRTQLATWYAILEPGDLFVLRRGPWDPSFFDGLDVDHREALATAIDGIVDEYAQDLSALARPDARFADTAMAGDLPRKYLPRYDYLFAKRFFASAVTVAWKLRAPGREDLACVAEELALHAILERAEAAYELQHDEAADFGWLWESCFQDQDYEFLFDPQDDGIEDSPYAATAGMTDLKFDAWFERFDNTGPVHPYAEGDDEWWRTPPTPVRPPDDDEDDT
jgi:DNA-binding CsgD family transcriptional regulator